MAQEPTLEHDSSPAAEGSALSGKWQIPLLALSSICFVAAVLFAVLRPRDEKVSPSTLAAQARTALAGAAYVRADELCDEFLADYPSHELAAEIHEIQGDANFSLGIREGEKAYYDKAARALRSANEVQPGGLASPTILLKLGRTHLRMEEPQLAINCYDRALDSAPADPLAIRMAKIEALKSLTPKADLEGALKEIEQIAATSDTLDQDEKAMVALAEADILNARGDHELAESKLRALLKEETGVERSKRFLLELAKTQRLAGQRTKALDTLQKVVAPAGLRDPGAEVLRGQAFLMHGRVYFEMSNYDKALEWFERTANEYPQAPEALAARLGIAETYLNLDELASASNIYAEIAPALRKLRPKGHRWINLDAAREALRVQSRASELKGRFREALRFIMLEESILRNPDRDVRIRRATILREVAGTAAAESEAAGDDDTLRSQKRLEAEQAWCEAGDTYVYVAEEFDGGTQDLYPDDLWEAATCYLQAGAHQEAVDVLARFVKEIPRDSRVPQARLEEARQYEVLGKWDEAIAALRTLTTESANTLAGFEGIYLLGEALVRKGPDFYQQAEDEFLCLLENSRVDPRSMWYGKSLLALGRLMHRRGHYDRAIIRLNEYIERYPEDPDALSASYLLASSLRNQGIAALAASAKAVRLVDKEALLQVRRQKLQSAIAEFVGLVQRYEQLSEAITPLQRREYRSVLFDLADSYDELDRTEEAIKAYNVIIYRFESLPCVMPAYVQLARMYLKMGRLDQYMAVLERARWTLEKIPEKAFVAQLGAPSKQYWEDWIRTMQAH